MTRVKKTYPLLVLGSVFVAAIVAGSSFYFQTRQGIREFKERALALRFERIYGGLEQFRKSCGRYPLTGEGLMALSKKPDTLLCSRYPAGGFVEQRVVCRDPWGYRYVYSSEGQSFVLKSLGTDGRPGGVGSGRDRSYSGFAGK